MAENEQHEIADALMNVIEPGSSWIVRGIANDVLVEPFDVADHQTGGDTFPPDLEACVDTLNEKLSSAGGDFSLWTLLLAAIGCVGIHLGWFQRWLGDATQYVQSFWFYAAVMVALFFFVGAISSWCEASVYRRWRDRLLREVEQAGLKLSEFYVEIKDSEEFDALFKQLRKDDQFLESKPGY